MASKKASAVPRRLDADFCNKICQFQTHAPQQIATLFDHLIGAGEQCWRQIEAKGLCGPRIDDQIKLGWLLDWKIGRLRPAQNLVDIVGGAPKQVRDVCSIGHQTTRFDVGPLTVQRRQSGR
jgi:hypothetical protein